MQWGGRTEGLPSINPSFLPLFLLPRIIHVGNVLARGVGKVVKCNFDPTAALLLHDVARMTIVGADSLYGALQQNASPFPRSRRPVHFLLFYLFFFQVVRAPSANDVALAWLGR